MDNMKRFLFAQTIDKSKMNTDECGFKQADHLNLHFSFILSLWFGLTQRNVLCQLRNTENVVDHRFDRSVIKYGKYCIHDSMKHGKHLYFVNFKKHSKFKSHI